jgi:hypothetical protein
VGAEGCGITVVRISGAAGRALQETPIAKLNAVLVEQIRGGTDLKTLTAAAALANARTFGGEDYVGFHTMMALGPAYLMSQQLPDALAPLAGDEGPLPQHQPHPGARRA